VNLETNWPLSKPRPAPAPGEIDVWRVRLPASADKLQACRALLADQEVESLARIKAEHRRRELIVGRAALRQLLAAAVGASPRELSFVHHGMGKPALSDAWRDCPLAFNVSHSRDWALIAIAQADRVGIDVEYAHRAADLGALARRFFAPAEAERVLALPEAERRWAFFRCWTRKEAIVKALGGGIAAGLDRFEVTVTADEPPRLVRADSDFGPAEDWSLVDLPLDPDYVATAAAPAAIAAVRCWELGEG